MLDTDVMLLIILDDSKMMTICNNNNIIDVIGLQVSLCYILVDLLMISKVLIMTIMS